MLLVPALNVGVGDPTVAEHLPKAGAVALWVAFVRHAWLSARQPVFDTDTPSNFSLNIQFAQPSSIKGVGTLVRTVLGSLLMAPRLAKVRTW